MNLNSRLGHILTNALDPHAADYQWQKQLATHRFLGLELMRVFPPNARMSGTASLDAWEDESEGAIKTWQDFESFPWPDPGNADFSVLEYYEKNLAIMLVAGSAKRPYWGGRLL